MITIEKVREKIKSKGVTPYEIAKNTNVSERAVGMILNGEVKNPHKSTLISIMDFLENTNNTEISNRNLSTEIKPKKNTEIIPKGVPYYDVDFSGGWDSSDLFITQKPSFYINSPDFERSEFAVNLFGNSISRRIPSSAIIGLKEVIDWQTYFPTNELYAVIMKNDLRTVKIVKREKETNNLILIPDPLPEYNQTQYESEIVPIDFIRSFFQVVAWGQFQRLVI